MALRQRAAEYQLALYPGGGAQYVRHRDALPDDGSEDHQRRVRAALAQPSTMRRPSSAALRRTSVRRSSSVHAWTATFACNLPVTQGGARTCLPAGVSFSSSGHAQLKLEMWLLWKRPQCLLSTAVCTFTRCSCCNADPMRARRCRSRQSCTPISAGRLRTAASCGCGRRRGWTPPRTPPLHPLPRPPPPPAPRTAPRPRQRPAGPRTARLARTRPTATPPPGTRPRGTPQRGRRGRRRTPRPGAAGPGWGRTPARAPPTACTRRPAPRAGTPLGPATTRARAPAPRTASPTALQAMGRRRAAAACASLALRMPTATPAATAASQARAPQTRYPARVPLA
jgi:hypothetical protein